ncbi:UNVERIFIED_CONTAM: hypothetical protein K2H54_073760 [Gekko kuhli]
MLPFLCLLVLGGLLTQNAEGNRYPQAIANLSPEMLHQLISQRMNSQDWQDRLLSLPLEDAVKNGMKQGGGGGFLSGLPILGGLVNNVVSGVLGVKIKKVSLLELDIKLDPHEARLIVTIPADIEVEVKCPLSLMGRLVHLKVYLDVQIGVRLLKDPYTGHIKLTIENCQNNPGHIRITLLENISPLFQLINNVVRLVTNILEKTVPHILQKELCPLANGLVQSVLDLLQGSMHSEMFHMSPESFSLYDDRMQLAYESKVEMPGGHSVMIPDSGPLPSMPLEGSAMNMVMSGQYLTKAVQALAPPQVLNLACQIKVGAEYSEASNVWAQNIRIGELSLSLAVGRSRMWLPVEVPVYTGHPSGGYGPRFIVRLNLDFLAHPSIVAGKLVFSLHNPRTQDLRLQSSSVGNFDAQHVTVIITQIASECIMPHLNRHLAQGIPMPLVQNVDSSSLHIAAGKDALLLVASRVVPVSA